jgi:DNA-binding XRE family transcriptional regulator
MAAMTGAAFKQARLSMRVTQATVAAWLGVSRKTICGLEKKDDVGYLYTFAMVGLLDMYLRMPSVSVG